MSSLRKFRLVSLLGCCAILVDAQSAPNDLANKTIEELMNVDVTTASRKQQKLSKVPAAVYVVTREAIERSGAANIPDLLRTVPGVHVAQVEANRWAISVRGFNASYSNKLLVMVDGRTVYTPSFSGVYWDQIDIPLDTIERIEVVRGSGGAVWGANAVNGVINIITENSSASTGSRIEASAGNFLRGSVDTRLGSKVNDNFSYRIFGDYRNYAGLVSPYSNAKADAWSMRHGGFRVDASLTPKDKLTVDGDGFSTRGGELLAFGASPQLGVVSSPLENDGFHLLTRWTHTHSDTSESSLQVYQNEYQRTDTGLQEQSNTVDVDFQNHTEVRGRNDVVWGAGYRFTADSARSTRSRAQQLLTQGFTVKVLPQEMGYSLFSGFLQDEFRISNDVSVVAGTKLEHNVFTGLEYEPTLRALWTPSDTSTLWAAVSRSVRQPSRIETSVLVDFAPIPILPGLTLNTEIAPNPAIASEKAMTYELGYRATPASRVSVDLATFYSRYSSLHGNNPGSVSLQPGAAGGLALAYPNGYAATGQATNFGGEIAASAQILSRWKMSGSYSYLHDVASTGITRSLTAQLGALLPSEYAVSLQRTLQASAGSALIAGSTPNHMAGLQSYFDLTRKWSFDQFVFYVGTLPAMQVPSYVRLDLHSGYKLSHGVQLRFGAQNLLAPRRLEFAEPSQFISTEPVRNISGGITWAF